MIGLKRFIFPSDLHFHVYLKSFQCTLVSWFFNHLHCWLLFCFKDFCESFVWWNTFSRFAFDLLNKKVTWSFHTICWVSMIEHIQSFHLWPMLSKYDKTQSVISLMTYQIRKKCEAFICHNEYLWWKTFSRFTFNLPYGKVSWCFLACLEWAIQKIYNPQIFLEFYCLVKLSIWNTTTKLTWS